MSYIPAYKQHKPSAFCLVEVISWGMAYVLSVRLKNVSAFVGSILTTPNCPNSLSQCVYNENTYIN